MMQKACQSHGREIISKTAELLSDLGNYLCVGANIKQR